MRHVVGLEHFRGILPGMGRELGGYSAGADDTDTDAVATEFFRQAIGKALQTPFGGAVDCSTGESVLSSERADVDDMPGAVADHFRGDGAAEQEHRLEIGV